MKQFLRVLQFECIGFLKQKWFRISTILICTIVALVMFIPRFFDVNNSMNKADNISKTSDSIGVYDPKGVLAQDILQNAFPKATFTKAKSVNDLKQAIEKGTLDSGFNIKDYTTYEYLIMDTKMSDNTKTIFSKLMEIQLSTKTLLDFGLNEKQATQAISTTVKGETTVLGKDGIQNYFYTYILVTAMYFVIMFYGQFIATNVASEKGNRTMEILITSTSSNALIFGKVLAGALASILQVSLMLGISILAYQINIDAWNHALDFLFNIPANVLLLFAAFGTLGYLFYAFIFGALGSLVSKVEEVSAAITPILFVFILAFFATIFSVMTNPDSILSTIALYVPFTSFMAMFARAAMGSVALWQVMISLVILALSTIVMGLLGAKLYRQGTLSYGNNFKLSNIINIAKHKR